MKKNTALSSKCKELELQMTKLESSKGFVDQLTELEFKNKALERRNADLVSRSQEMEDRISELTAKENEMQGLFVSGHLYSCFTYHILKD